MKRFYLSFVLALTGLIAHAQCTSTFSSAGASCTTFAMWVRISSLVGYSGTISDGSACNSTGFLWQTSMTCTVLAGSTYTANIATGANFPTNIQAWIDFNDNNVFESTETVGGHSRLGPNSGSFPITIPPTVPAGSHRFRIQGLYPDCCNSPYYPSQLPCAGSGPYTYGEQRDYSINVIYPSPMVTTSPSTLAFGTITTGGLSPVQSFSVSGTFMSAGPISLAPPAGYELSLSPTSGFSSSPLTISYTVPDIATTPVYVRFAPTSIALYNTSVAITGGGLVSTAYQSLNGRGGPACSGTPSAPVASISATSGTPTTPLLLSVSGISVGGLHYQWQSSLYSGGGFTDISGATSFAYTYVGLRTPTYFRCKVTCPGSAPVASNSVFANTALTPIGCIPSCISSSGVCSNSFMVANASYPFLLTGDGGTSINDATPCSSSQVYFDQTASMGCTMSIGGSYTATVGNSVGNRNSCQIWIDYNNDGSFATSETIGGTAFWTSGRTNPTLSIPTDPSILPGTYRMRVIVEYGNGCTGTYHCYPSILPCPTNTNTQYIEARDYSVTLQYAPCSGVPGTGTIYTETPTACGAISTELLHLLPPMSSGITYNWQVSTTSATAGFSNISGATNPYYSTTVTATTWYRMRSTCTGSGLSSNTPGYALTVNAVPTAFSGPSSICVGRPSGLTTTPSGGLWSSSHTSIATVAFGTGIVSGVLPGTSVMTYTMPTGCYQTGMVTVKPAPAAITGGTQVCASGATVALSNATIGGTWASSDNTLATVGATGLVTGVVPGVTYITYIATNGCFAVQPITIQALPPAIAGSGNVCVNEDIALTNSVPGGHWSSSSDFNATIGSLSGIVTGQASGVLTITYTTPTGCHATMPLVVNAEPLPISGPASLCVGGSSTVAGVGGGTWMSSNPSIASVDMVSGTVSGINNGTVRITYTLPTGCATTRIQTVNALPMVFSVTGGGNYCLGGSGVHVGLSGSDNGISYQLYEGTTAVGSPLPGSSSGIDFGTFTAIGTYSVQAINGTTGCVNSMAGIATIGYSPLPTRFTVGGTGTYCAGGTGLELTLSGSELSATYRLYHSGSPVGALVNGTGGPVSMGWQTVGGTYTVLATSGTTTCSDTMNGTADVFVSPVPLVYNVGGGGRYCAGGTGREVTIDNSTPGINYQLYANGIAAGSPVPGTGAALSMLSHTTPGVYTVVATDITNACTSNMNGSATIGIDPLPAVFPATGGGSYCAGGIGAHVGVGFGVPGIRYRLYDGTMTEILSKDGAGSGLDFGILTAPGTYTADAISAAGCVSNMSGSATITVHPVPVPQVVGGGGAYCTGMPGVQVTLAASEVGFNYQLLRGTTPVGSALAGTGANLDFGMYTTIGTYNVKAISPITGCGGAMANTVTINVNPVPSQFVVSGGGSFCTGGTGVHIFQNNSAVGVTYELYQSGIATGISMPGTGAALDFGLVTTPGIYTAMATNDATGCARTMTSSAVIALQPLPASYAVTGGGNYCVGGAGRPVGIATSNTGIKYQLMNGGSPVGAPVMGTGAAFDFGTYMIAGTYSVRAENAVTGCATDMTGAATIGILPLPATYTVTGGGNYCLGGAGRSVGLSTSETGVDYQLYRGTAPVGGPVAGVTGVALDFGPVTAAGIYTAKAVDAISGCVSNMVGTATVGTWPLPTTYTVTGGGNYCAGGTGAPIGLAASNAGTDYTLYQGSTPMDTVVGTGAAISFGLQTVAGTYSVTAINTTTSCSNNMAGTATIGIMPLVAPVVNIVREGTTLICTGNTETLVAIPTNGGSSPTYEWQVNGVTVTGATSNTYRYVPNDGDGVTAILTSNAECLSTTTDTETYLLMVYPLLTPTVSITASPAAIVCPGATITFTPTAVHGGTDPSYKWYRNGDHIATGATFSYTPGDEDVVFAILASNADCRTTSAALSNNIVVELDSPILPQFALSVFPGTSIVSGQSASFRAVDVRAGASYTYVWRVNGVVQTTTTAEFTPAAPLAHNDQVSCTITSTNACGSKSTTQKVHMNVSTVGIAEVAAGQTDIRLIPNPNKGNFVIKGQTGLAVDGMWRAEVTNTLGQVVYSAQLQSSNGMLDAQLQLGTQVAPGMYLLHLYTGETSQIIHFVIE